MPAQRLDLVLRLEQRVCGRHGAAAHDGRDGRVRAGRRAVEEGTHGRVALGHPGPVVEQAGRAGERRERHGHKAAAEALERAQRGMEGACGQRVAEELERVGHADTQPFKAIGAQQRRHRAAAVRVLRVGSGGKRGHRPRVFRGEREHRHAVEAAARRHDAARRQPAARGLQAADVAEGRRDATRAGGVGAQRERHLSGGHRVGRSRAGAAAHAVRVERIRHRAVGRSRADQTGGELVEVRLADGDGPGVGEPLHDRGVRLGGPARIAGAGGGGGQTRDVDVVLDRVRHAEQRPLLEGARAFGAQQRVAFVGACQQQLAGHRGDPRGGRAARLRRDRPLHQAPHRQSAFTQRVLQLGQGSRFDRHRNAPRICACFLVCKIKARAMPPRAMPRGCAPRGGVSRRTAGRGARCRRRGRRTPRPP